MGYVLASDENNSVNSLGESELWSILTSTLMDTPRLQLQDVVEDVSEDDLKVSRKAL